MELQHHGILGQKWGKKNGPPYPLSRTGDWSASEKRQQKKNYKEIKKSGRNRRNAKISNSIREDVESRISEKTKSDIARLDRAFEKTKSKSENLYDWRENVRTYLLDQGLRKQSYNDVLNAYSNYNKELKNAINDSIGKYRDRPLHRYYYPNTTVSEFVYREMKK